MEYLTQPNLLLEALACLGRRASGRTWEYTEQRLLTRRADTDMAFRKSFGELQTFTRRLIKATSFDESADDTLFHNIEGFPYNAIGSSSPAFLLFYPEIGTFDGDLAAVTAHITSLSQEQTARNILDTLSLTDDIEADAVISVSQYMSIVLALDIPDASKLALLNLINDYPDIAQKASEIIAPLLASLEEELPAMIKLTSHFADAMRNIPEEDFFGHMTHLKNTDSSRFRIHPFIFGMDTILTCETTDSDNTVDIYCGFLREQLLDIMGSEADAKDRVYDQYHLLGDRTRYDMVRFLQAHSAYGQELATEFDLARNTIHHHMSKLVESGLVSATISGNRVYYSLDKAGFSAFLKEQEELFLPR